MAAEQPPRYGNEWGRGERPVGAFSCHRLAGDCSSNLALSPLEQYQGTCTLYRTYGTFDSVIFRDERDSYSFDPSNCRGHSFLTHQR